MDFFQQLIMIVEKLTHFLVIFLDCWGKRIANFHISYNALFFTMYGSARLIRNMRITMIGIQV